MRYMQGKNEANIEPPTQIYASRILKQYDKYFISGPGASMLSF